MGTKNERGTVMLESTYCILACIIVILFLMSFGFFLYQQTVVSITANEVAAEVAQTYKLKQVEDSASVTADDIVEVGKYRYLLFKGSFNRANERKAKNLAEVRLSLSSLAKEESGVTVDVKMIPDDIGRRHFQVTVSQKYSFLLGGVLSLIGQEDAQKIEATAYVESFDVLNYMNTIKAARYGLDKMTDLDDTGILGLMDKAIQLANGLLN